MPTPQPLVQARLKVQRLTLEYNDGDWSNPPMPMVPFIAKDALSVEVLEFYLRRLRETRRQRIDHCRGRVRRMAAEGQQPYAGMHPVDLDDAGVTMADTMTAEVAALLADFYRWQAENPDKVTFPD